MWIHWCRQLWGTGACSPNIQQFIFWLILDVTNYDAMTAIFCSYLSRCFTVCDSSFCNLVVTTRICFLSFLWDQLFLCRPSFVPSPLLTKSWRCRHVNMMTYDFRLSSIAPSVACVNKWSHSFTCHPGTCIHKWNKSYLPLLPRHSVSLQFVRYSFPVPLRIGGWVGPSASVTDASIWICLFLSLLCVVGLLCCWKYTARKSSDNGRFIQDWI